MARPKAGSNLTIAQLESMLMDKKRDLGELASQRNSLVKQLSDLDARIASMGGSSSGNSSGTFSSSGKRMGRPPKMASFGSSTNSSTSASGSGKSTSGSLGMTSSGRARNAKSLVETLVEVLGASSDAMKVGDIVDGVLKSGYKTGSDNFRGIVNQTLIKERKRFVSTGRGLYASKGKK